MFVQQGIWRATGRLSSCSFEGHEAPTPALTTKTLAAAGSHWGRAHQIGHHLCDHKHGSPWALGPFSKPATAANRRSARKRRNAEGTDLQNCG